MSSVRCENGMWEWDVGMVFVVFSHLGKARAFARTLPKCPDPHSYISIEKTNASRGKSDRNRNCELGNEIPIVVSVGLRLVSRNDGFRC